MYPSDQNPNSELPELLKKLKDNTSGFKTPPDYFNQLQAKMIDHVIEPEAETKVSWIDQLMNGFSVLYPHRLAIASMLVFAVVITAVVQDRQQIGSAEIAIATLNQDDLDYFIENELEELNNQELIATLEDDILSEVVVQSPYDAALTAPAIDEYIEELDDNNLLDFE